MSTVMYCYRLKKSDLWPFCDRVKQFYQEKSFQYLMVRELEEKARNKEIDFLDALDKLKELISKHPDWFKVQLQFFERGRYWLVRVLENSFFFMNNMDQFPEISPVFYDDRSDLEPEERRNRKITLWVDDQINARHYLLYPVVNEENLSNFMWNLAWEYKKENFSTSVETNT